MPQSSSHFSSNPGLPITPISVASPLAAMPSFDKNGFTPAQASLSRLQQIISLLDNSLRLPNTPRAFAIYLMGLAIVFAGAFMHVLVAAQIMQAQFTLSQLQNDFGALEQQNGELIFRIAHETSLTRLHSRINSMGYVPVQEREYIVKQDEVFAATRPESTPSSNWALNSAESASSTTSVNTANMNTANTIPSTVVMETRTTSTQLPSVNWGGEFSSWKNFWDSLWPTDAPSPTPTTSTKPTGNEANFWSVWWKQASDQSEKWLDQFANQ